MMNLYQVKDMIAVIDSGERREEGWDIG